MRRLVSDTLNTFTIILLARIYCFSKDIFFKSNVIYQMLFIYSLDVEAHHRLHCPEEPQKGRNSCPQLATVVWKLWNKHSRTFSAYHITEWTITQHNRTIYICADKFWMFDSFLQKRWLDILCSSLSSLLQMQSNMTRGKCY
jgi:hypothetical protein